MNSTASESSSAHQAFRARSDIPFYISLAILSGVYVVLIVGMLLAEILFLVPPNRLVIAVAKKNPHDIKRLQDLTNPELKIGLGDQKSDFGRATSTLLQLLWMENSFVNLKRETPIEYADDKMQLMDGVSTGVLDAAIVPDDAFTDAQLALLVKKNNPKQISSLQDLGRADLRVGLIAQSESSAGRRTRRLLKAAGVLTELVKKDRKHPVFYGKSQQILVKKLLNDELDVILASPRDVGSAKKRIQLVRPLVKVTIDQRRFPNHVSSIWYPLWWLQVKVAALFAPLAHPEIRYALKLSLISCTVTTILSLWVAVPFGYLMSRFRFPGKMLIDAILDIPIVLPPLVIGLALLILFKTPIGEFIDNHILTVTYAVPSVILAQFSVACAFAVRTMRVSFDQISPRHEQVAQTLGCSRGQAFWKVVLPEARRGMVTAATLAWARALGEFGPILIFSTATRMRTEVLPTTVYLELNVGNIETAVAVSLLMIIAAGIVLVIVRVFGMEKTPIQLK